MSIWLGVKNSGVYRKTAVGTMCAAALVTMPLVLADRLNDKDVKALIERVNHDRDRFEDQLDGRLKRSIVVAAGELRWGERVESSGRQSE